nr:hypothetical protein [Tanacetum cinerariifolium]
SASSAVTYTSVYTDSKPGRVFWGADEELSIGGSLLVIVHEYDGLPMLPVAPPSPDYIHGLEEPHTPPAPQDEDEHEPMFIQPHDLDFYVAESDPEEDPEEYEDDEIEDGLVDYPIDGGDDEDDDDGDSSGDDDDDDDDDEEDEEEHLAPTDSAIVIATDELAAISFPPEAEVERLLAMPTPSPSPLASLSPPSTGERLARCTPPAALPSPPLPPPLHMLPPVDRRDDIPETEMPPRKREGSTARPTGGRGIDYGFVSTLDAEARRRGIGEMQQTEITELRETNRRRQAQMAETLRVMGDMRRETHDMQAELLALREQPRRVGQPRGDARVPNHQDATRDVDSHI